MKYILKRVEFDCICELANVMDDYILDNAPTGEYPVVSAYANYEVAKALVEALIMLDNPIGAILELEDYEMSHYDREYVVYLSEDGVTCEKNYHKDGYYNGGGDISFVHEDCNSKLLNHIDSRFIYEFSFGECGEDDEECEEECTCDECQCACEEETKPSTTSKKSYTVNSKPVNKEEFLKVEEEFNKEIKDSLLSWCEVMDEMNELRKLFRW